MRPYRVRLSDTVRQDIVDVLQYTFEQFGQTQHDAYRNLIEDSLVAIENEPTQAPSKQRDGLNEDTWIRPIRKPGQNARHLIIYRIASDGLIEVGRLLHDAADIERHLPEDYLR
ncbi:MAG: type II toxin-antitoxin system RelE/ParE family toxin [Phycisphaeraceae bacterium]